MVRVTEHSPLKTTEMDQAPWSRKRNDSDMTEISQIMSEIKDIGNSQYFEQYNSKGINVNTHTESLETNYILFPRVSICCHCQRMWMPKVYIVSKDN